MPYLNRIEIIGHVGGEPQTRLSAKGTMIVKFSVATTYKEETTWHNVVAFSLPDWLIGMLKKGALVYIEGRQEHSKYTKDGETKYFSQIVAYKVMPLEKSEKQTETKQEEPQGEDLPF